MVGVGSGIMIVWWVLDPGSGWCGGYWIQDPGDMVGAGSRSEIESARWVCWSPEPDPGPRP